MAEKRYGYYNGSLVTDSQVFQLQFTSYNITKYCIQPKLLDPNSAKACQIKKNSYYIYFNSPFFCTEPNQNSLLSLVSTTFWPRDPKKRFIIIPYIIPITWGISYPRPGGSPFKTPAGEPRSRSLIGSHCPRPLQSVRHGASPLRLSLKPWEVEHFFSVSFGKKQENRFHFTKH